MTTIATIAAAGFCAAAMLAATAPDEFEVARAGRVEAAACAAGALLIGPACPEAAPPCGRVDRSALASAAFPEAPRGVCLVIFDDADRPQG